VKSAISAQLAQPQPSGDPYVDQLRVYATLLDGVDVAMCAFDLEDRALVWNRTFLRFFPEHDGHVQVGEHYGDNLRRFYRGRLDASEIGRIEEYVQAGIERHQSQTQPYEFDHGGLRLQVSSLPIAGRGRVRVWRSLRPSATGRRQPAPQESGELLENVPQALLVCDPEGHILWSNAAFHALCDAEDGAALAGRTMESVIEAAWAAAQPRELGRGEKGIATLREHLRFPGAPFDLPMPRDRVFRVIARPAHDGALLYALSDISALKLNEEALQLAMDNAGRGIVRFDADGRVALYNRDALRLLDLPDDLLAGSPSFSEVIRFQKDRGDFAAADMQWAAQALTEAEASGARMFGPGHYLRRTRAGRVLEVSTRELPDGGVIRTYADVTEYVRAESALREQTRALEITLDSMGQGLSAMDAQGRIVLWNRRYQELLNLPASLLASKPTMEQVVRFQIERGDFGQNFEFVDGVARGYVALGDKLSVLQGPETYLRRTPEGKTLEVTTLPLPDGGAVRTFTDVTAYVNTREVLAQKQAQLGAILNTLPDRVWLKDTNGVYLLSNPAHQQFYGVTEVEVIGLSDEQLVGPALARLRAESDQQAMRSDQPITFEQVETRIDGRIQNSEIVKVPMRDEQGRCTGVLGIARDITARKQVEADLIQAKEEALSASSAKSRFLSNMSHEIRTPMNAILGMLTLLRGSELSVRQDDYVGKAEGAARSLLSLLNDILDFSKIEAGKMTLDCHPFSLERMFADLAVILSSNLGDKPLELLYDLDAAIPDQLVGDDMRLRQILINLGGNAIKFTSEGEVIVRTRLVQIDSDAASIEFSVEDSGIGITPEQQARLFSDFMQATDQTSRQFGGTGLGLGICRRLTQLMESTLHLASTPGVGSRFWFTVKLPVVPAAAEGQPAEARARRRVLVVDDNHLARDTLAAVCRAAGWQVETAEDGKQALARVAAAAARGNAYDTILVDWMMPDMDGWQTCARIRALLPGRVPLVIMVTAKGREMLERMPDTEQALLDGYLVKPVTPGMLKAVVAGGKMEVPATAGAASLPMELPLRGLRILVAEDNPVNQQIASELLARQGAQVHVAADGAEALEQVAIGSPPDVVLMDVQMPVMDGLTATRELRKKFSASELPVIAMTANAMDSDRDDCLAAGMNDHVSKPFILEHVVARILATVGRPGPGDMQAIKTADGPQAERPSASVFDRAAALRQMGGDEELLDVALSTFARTLRKLEGELARDAGPSRDELGRILHSIKGSAATVGAHALASAAADGERALESGRDGDGAWLQHFRARIAETLREIG
jgi:PAS domain S-box-containing protein